MEAAQTNRQRLVDAAGIAVIFLLVLTAWHAGRMFYGTVLQAAPDRIVSLHGVRFWETAVLRDVTQRSIILAPTVFLVGAILFLLRLALTLRVLEFLYKDSEKAGDRGFAGYTVNTVSLVVQLALTYLMVNASRAADARLALFLLLCVFAVNGLWLFWIYLVADRTEKGPLRGVWRAGLVSVVFAAVLVPTLWYWETAFGQNSGDTVLRSLNVAIAGAFMVLLCAVDGYVQAQTYAPKERPSGTRYTVAAVLAAILLALALYLIGAALSSPAFWK